MTAERASVAVIGGGWAGCAAALTLAEAGIRVTLYEAARTLGGRARAVALEGQALDNGQHILLGAYSESLGMIDRLNRANGSSPLWRLPLSLRQPPEFALACPRLPAPFNLLAGLLSSRGLSVREKLSAARFAYDLLSGRSATEGLSVGALTCTQTERLNRLLWHPLCVSALNTPPGSASARVFREVMRGAFSGAMRDSDLVLPRRDLTALLPGPAAARITALGGTVRTASRVLALDEAPDSIAVATRDDRLTFSHVVVATAPQHVASLVARIPALVPVAAATATYHYESIATGYIQYDRSFRLGHAFYALADGPAQFVFDRGQSHGQHGLMAFVASAAGSLDADWLERAERQLRTIARPGGGQWRRAIVEKQATYRCVPGLARPDTRTAHSRVSLAGDYTAGPYPATLESAVRSGVQSSTILIEQL